MPSRAPGAPGRSPLRLAVIRRPGGQAAGLGGFRPLPQREVARIALHRCLGVAGGLHVVESLSAQRAVLGEGAHIEVDVTVGRVGVPGLDEPVHEPDHLGHMPGGAWLVGRRQAAEDVVGPGEGSLVAHGDLPEGHALIRAPGKDLVVDVSDVAHEGDVVAGSLEPAPEDVEGQA